MRDREAEFTTRDLSRSELLEVLETACSALEEGFSGIDDGVLDDEYPSMWAA